MTPPPRGLLSLEDAVSPPHSLSVIYRNSARHARTKPPAGRTAPGRPLFPLRGLARAPPPKFHVVIDLTGSSPARFIRSALPEWGALASPPAVGSIVIKWAHPWGADLECRAPGRPPMVICD